jgi:hypothetical protein
MQLCWAHLKKNILGIADYARRASTRQSCRDALTIVARLFRLGIVSAVICGLDRQQLLEKSIPLQRKLFALPEAHLDDADS